MTKGQRSRYLKQFMRYICQELCKVLAGGSITYTCVISRIFLDTPSTPHLVAAVGSANSTGGESSGGELRQIAGWTTKDYNREVNRHPS